MQLLGRLMVAMCYVVITVILRWTANYKASGSHLHDLQALFEQLELSMRYSDHLACSDD